MLLAHAAAPGPRRVDGLRDGRRAGSGTATRYEAECVVTGGQRAGADRNPSETFSISSRRPRGRSSAGRHRQPPIVPTGSGGIRPSAPRGVRPAIPAAGLADEASLLGVPVVTTRSPARPAPDRRVRMFFDHWFYLRNTYASLVHVHMRTSASGGRLAGWLSAVIRRTRSSVSSTRRRSRGSEPVACEHRPPTGR